MQLVDANVLLYAVNERAAHHDRSRSWLDACLGGEGTVGFCWAVLLAFVRLSTHRAVFERPLSSAQALSVANVWLGQPGAVAVSPGPRHLTILEGLLGLAGTGGNLVNDAHLAALALENRAEVVSFDGDFARFEPVRWTLPTAP
jgi:toxin-antitoxin system PIN domain toxin